MALLIHNRRCNEKTALSNSQGQEAVWINRSSEKWWIPMKAAQLLKFKQRHPRRNLPAALARKRGESNFVSTFSKAYIASTASGGVGGKEFALSGFGIADFVWIAWRNAVNPDEGSALSIEKLKSLLNRHKLTAFEMKLSDWRKGLAQAYRYSYFADLAVVVLMPELAATAKADLDLFRESNVGLWSFHPATGAIRKLFTPRQSGPRNPRAKDKALESLGRSLQFSQLRK
ncbi:MAG: hypothetical protein ABSA83_19070 [Verrucomicrobiota bacterium]|jgi:hypothetical protein